MTAKHTPTNESRVRVKTLAGYGIPEQQIATLEGLKDPKTLRKHYRAELDAGIATANVNIGRTNYELAVGRDAVTDNQGNVIRPALPPNPNVAMFLAKTRLGFKEITTHEHSGPDGKPIETRRTDVDLSKLSDAEVEAFRALLSKAGATPAGGGRRTRAAGPTD